jgi:STE24 endopeptidase
VNQDKSARYHALKRRAAVLSVAWSAAFLIGLALTPASGWLAGLSRRLAGHVSHASWLAPALAVAAYVLTVGFLHETVSLSIGFYSGFLLEHRYGLSTERLRSWAVDQLKAGLVGAGLSVAGFALLYAAIARWPRDWWMPAAAGFTLFVIVMARLAPVVLLPLFFAFKPLDREALRGRLLALAARAGVPVTDVFEWQLGDRTKKGNAALTGLGRTRRILVSDTLLASCSDDEIEVILAHEIGHHAHHDIWKGIALEAVVAAAGFLAASRVLIQLSPRLGWQGVSDVAGLPALLLTAGLLSLVLVPAANAYSRRAERAADLFALEVTGSAGAFATAMQRLGAQNLSEERPSRLSRWLFHTHPPFAERVEAARRWERARAGGGPTAERGGGGAPATFSA